ncbi:MAG: RNA-binding protein [Syntrophomonadaceae bacterium]|jgi:large subunit ribosomal protein L14e
MLGKVVYSKTGRDQGRIFVIVGVVNDRLVTLADGDLRRIENPKVKNIKHLQFTGMKAEEIIAIIKSGEIPGNHILRRYLKNASATGASNGKEVW